MTAPETWLDLEGIEARANAATPGPWAYEGVSDKANDYIVGIVCPVDKKHNVGPQISGNVRHHPHFYNTKTDKFGEWYCEEIAVLDETSHTSDGGCGSDACFIAHAREDVPALLAALHAATARADEAERRADVWFKTHNAHREANAALGKANGELFKRACEATARADEAESERDLLTAALDCYSDEQARLRAEMTAATSRADRLETALRNDQWEVVMGAIDKWTKHGGSDLVALGIIGRGLLILDESRRAALNRIDAALSQPEETDNG